MIPPVIMIPRSPTHTLFYLYGDPDLYLLIYSKHPIKVTIKKIQKCFYQKSVQWLIAKWGYEPTL